MEKGDINIFFMYAKRKQMSVDRALTTLERDN